MAKWVDGTSKYVLSNKLFLKILPKVLKYHAKYFLTQLNNVSLSLCLQALLVKRGKTDSSDKSDKIICGSESILNNFRFMHIFKNI